ncbi:unnamed protein product [Larinioides sclopetarius]|uniref:Uncharacterized protein n=1 Tax=Larinioides sclopetarius TaxID=280406 RepID=A0AAV2BWD5_9ARAC
MHLAKQRRILLCRFENDGNIHHT